MTAVLAPDTAFATQQCRCGCPRQAHKVTHDRGWRYTACRTRHRLACDEFDPAEQQAAPTAQAAPPIRIPAAALANPPDTAAQPTPALPSTPASPARRRPDRPPLDEQVAAWAAGRLTTAAASEMLARWPAWHCEGCGGRYLQPYPTHGAPQPCRGRLIPVTVTITRRTAVSVDG